MHPVKKFVKKNRILVTAFLIAGLTFATFCIYWVIYLKNAHSTFENYYAFRGCRQLVEKTDTYGICKLAEGKEIKIVKFDNRWFLDGDLPCGFLCF